MDPMTMIININPVMVRVIIFFMRYNSVLVFWPS